tara:strand:- start:772 stop:1326 length:555 start_codon:yes stop_codon:yes gene_type:complete
LKFIPQSIPDIILIEPTVQIDSRGYFFETFNQDDFENNIGYKVNFCQDNESKSTKGVLRGLHYQLPPYSQAKLVRVIEGNVLDVAVDIRKSSKTYGKYVALELSSMNKYQLFIPKGFAHGFQVLSNNAIFSYKVDNLYAPDSERGIAYNDPNLAIDWELPIESTHISDKDKSNPFLNKASDLFS